MASGEPVRVKMYTTLICPYCVRAKMLLKRRGIDFEEIRVDRDHDLRGWLVKTTGMRTVPQIFIDDVPIGGSDELYDLDVSGELASRLAVAPA